jgi:hypothetical protein
MTTAPTCSRTWQAEAAEDRRLSEADRASFERHVATCAVCERAVRELVGLRSLGADVTETSPLEHRRARNELLRRANDVTLGAAHRFPWRGLAVALALLALALGAGIGLRARAPAERAAAAEPSYDMTASAGAEWSALERGSTLRLAAKRGHFELSVRHLGPLQRFILVLPDGELEVQGTRFAVDVDGARTLGVVVEEGRVALRLRGPDRAPMLLRAGERFAAAAPSAIASAAPSAAPSTVVSAAPRATSVAASPSEQAATPVPAARSGSSSSGSEPHAREESPRASDEARPDAGAYDARGVEFTQAMAAFSAGNYGQAERRLLAFAARYPSDLRSEDAMFLAAVASSRRGDQDGAGALARKYLERYPNGLRRLEAERLVRGR